MARVYTDISHFRAPYKNWPYLGIGGFGGFGAVPTDNSTGLKLVSPSFFAGFQDELKRSIIGILPTFEQDLRKNGFGQLVTELVSPDDPRLKDPKQNAASVVFNITKMLSEAKPILPYAILISDSVSSEEGTKWVKPGGRQLIVSINPRVTAALARADVPSVKDYIAYNIAISNDPGLSLAAAVAKNTKPGEEFKTDESVVGAKKAGLLGPVGIGLLAVAGLGVLAFFAKKK